MTGTIGPCRNATFGWLLFVENLSMTEQLDQDDDLELTPEQQDAADVAAEAQFEAAFKAARGGDTHAGGSTKTDDATAAAPADDADGDPDADQDGAPDGEQQPAAAAEANPGDEPVTLTRREVEAMRSALASLPTLQEELRKSAEKTNGRLGNVMQSIESIRAQAAQGIRPSALTMKRLKAEYPDLGEIFEQDLADVFGSTAAPAAAPEQQDPNDAASGATPGAAQDDPLAHPEVQATLQAAEMRIVSATHPDWQELRETPEFVTWYGTLPADAQQLLASSWKSDVLNGAFSEFKQWKQQQAAAQQQQAQAQTASKQRQNRVENAIPATTGSPTGVSAVDDEEAFLAGFKQVRGK